MNRTPFFTYSPKQWTFAFILAFGQKNALAIGIGPFTFTIGAI